MATNNTFPVSAEHYIIGIGASAGGLEPINELFDNMPDDTGFSFVVVQHLSPDHKSLMAELLARHTSMKVMEAEHGMQVTPNCIYLIPSKKIMTLSNGSLMLHDKERTLVPNNAIDMFFDSLAHAKGNNAVGIILSGTGTDGTKGIESIKNSGGLVIVQDPISADFDGMPSSAIATGLVDLILPPALMPEELTECLRESPPTRSLHAFDKADEKVIDEILTLVKNTTSHDFNDYKKPTITRRLAKNMAEKGFKSVTDYYNHLVDHPEDIVNLGKEFLINVTKFFRDPEAFEEVRSKIIPSIFSAKKPHDVIKAWVVACSTGEEAYSLAMLFYEYMDNIRNHDYNIKIFATDIDKDALQTASNGCYPESISKDISPARLANFFVKEGTGYRIVPALRKMVVFAFHDITKDPPFSKLDLLSCRNMLIYMNLKLQRHVLKTFSFALNPGASLLLGASENVGPLKETMKELNKKWKIYKCIGKSRLSGNESFMPPIRPSTLVPVNTSNKPKNAVSNLAEIFRETLMEEHRYAGILIDENMEVKHAIGHFKDFMHFPENNLTFNLLKLIPPDLGVALGMTIRKSIHEQEKTVLRNVRMQNGKTERSVNIIVKPFLHQQEYQQSFLFVILQENEKERKKVKKPASRKANAIDSQRIEELENELRETKENLQSVIEELESSNEELLTSNEEMISANEELQSTNEELQSLNEELHTVSAEHQSKIKELIELNDDLNNYFRNSEIGQVLVDKHMIVRKFSPAITSQINLIESDIGRPLNDITNNLLETDLLSEIKRVIISNEGTKREVVTNDKRCFLMKINPYIRQDRTLDGVVVNFIDITEIKQLTGILEGVFNSSISAICARKAVRDKQNRIIDFELIAANQAVEKMMDMTQQELEGKSIFDGSMIDNSYFERYVKVVESGHDDSFEFFLELTNRWYEGVVVKMLDGIVSTFTDITQRRNTADVIAKSFEDLKITSSKLQELNYKLEQSNMDLLQFASVASHDLKEPLRKIQTFGNLLSDKIVKKLEPSEKNYLEKIITSSHRMQVLIEDVLTLSKLSNTHLPISKTDLTSVVQHIMEDLEILIREKGTQVFIGKLPVVEAVAGQIHQLFQNLISNALKFNDGPKPILKIESRYVRPDEAVEYAIDPDDHVVLCVEDNGIGFEEKYKEKIFGIFQRLHGNLHYPGTGIGLTICKKIVDNHHGFIKAESEPGKGSRFIIILPRKHRNVSGKEALKKSNGVMQQ
ncbi:MAG TPA: chemotaxis protein CheB [Chryseosolibacter sp.]|nr:chemotaxis protein CheB [Chryseosolibacter sp.]